MKPGEFRNDHQESWFNGDFLWSLMVLFYGINGGLMGLIVI
jgi:hypothetical protein